MNIELTKLIEKIGKERAISILERELRIAEDDGVLTIVANEKIHHLPTNKLRGEIYIASSGNLDFSSFSSVELEYRNVLSGLASVLKSKSWKKIFLVPFGPTTLSLQIKMMVYKVTSIDTIDLFYDGRGNYHDIEIEQRLIISRA